MEPKDYPYVIIKRTKWDPSSASIVDKIDIQICGDKDIEELTKLAEKTYYDILNNEKIRKRNTPI